MTKVPVPRPEEAVIDVSFIAVDGALPIYFQTHEILSARRVALSSGCARYALSIDEQAIGVLIVQAVDLGLPDEVKETDPAFFDNREYGEQTYLFMSIANANSETAERTRRFLIAELWKLIGFLHAERAYRLPYVHRATIMHFNAPGSLAPTGDTAPPVSVRRAPRRGPKELPENIWARDEAAKGKTISELLPEYARRRKMNPVDARELLRKALQTERAKRKQQPE
jgi:hypothetical protein